MPVLALLLQAHDGLSGNDLWLWVLGIVAAVVLGAGAFWANAVYTRLGRIEEMSAKAAADFAAVDVRVRALERTTATAVSRELYDRFDRDVGRQLAELKHGIDRVHMRLDGVVRERRGTDDREA